MTVDVEDWMDAAGREGVPPEFRHGQPRVELATSVLLELLASHAARATFFFLGTVAEKYPNLVKAVVAEGHRVGCHGWEHRVLSASTPQQLRQDVQRARALLEDLSGQPVQGYRAPWFSLGRKTAWALDVLREAGFTYDSSLFPCWNPMYGDGTAARGAHRTRAGLLEVPPAVAAVGPLRIPVAGGFYWRALPYSLIRWGIDRLGKEGIPAVLYMHPWELDTAQPRAPMGRIAGIIHYANRDKARYVLERLLRWLRFAPIEEVFPESTSPLPL